MREGCHGRFIAPEVVPQTDKSENDPHAPDLGALTTKRYIPCRGGVGARKGRGLDSKLTR